ncbi:MAG: hypothetical protein AAB415_02820 [Patescibacteria group bacterium]
MSCMDWTNVPAGTYNGAIQRFVGALGENAERVLVMINLRESFASEIAEFANHRALELLKPLAVETMIANHRRLITVNYGPADKPRTIEEMIAAGRYDWGNKDITADHFPISGVGIVAYEPKLFHFDEDISSDEAERRIKADDLTNPWEPARIEHTLSYGAAFPEDQRKFLIVGLGSVALINGSRCVVCLYGRGSLRRLGLFGRGGGWPGVCRFLAVRQISVA